MKNKFEEIVRAIDKWSSEDSKNTDDECYGIISSVYKLYLKTDFHAKLIVSVVQIPAQFDDDPEKLKYLSEKYKILFKYFNWLHVSFIL